MVAGSSRERLHKMEVTLDKRPTPVRLESLLGEFTEASESRISETMHSEEWAPTIRGYVAFDRRELGVETTIIHPRKWWEVVSCHPPNRWEVRR